MWTFNDVGFVTQDEAFDWGFSGVLLRGSGLLWDLRLIDTYESYIYLILLFLLVLWVIVMIVI